MSLHSKHLLDNLVFYDGQRWYDAIGSTVKKFLEDFIGTPLTTDSPVGWTTTLVEAGGGESTVALDDGEVGGAIVLTTDNFENDGVQIQLKGEAFKLVAATRLYFGARLKIDTATQSDFFVGLGITDTTLLDGATDYVGFRKVDGTTSILAVLNKNTTETTGAALTCDTSYHIYEFLFDGTVVDFFVDGTLITRIVQTYLPDDEALTPTLAVLAGTTAAVVLTCDWIRCIQLN